MHQLPCRASAEPRSLLRLLLVWVSEVPADSATIRLLLWRRNLGGALGTCLRPLHMAPAEIRKGTMHTLVRFGQWLSVRKNFLLFSTVGVGGPSFVLMFVWLRHEIGDDLGLWLLVGPMIFVGGYVWGLIMWQFFKAKRRQ
jgi:hypothetical protein